MQCLEVSLSHLGKSWEYGGTAVEELGLEVGVKEDHLGRVLVRSSVFLEEQGFEPSNFLVGFLLPFF